MKERTSHFADVDTGKFNPSSLLGLLLVICSVTCGTPLAAGLPVTVDTSMLLQLYWPQDIRRQPP